MISDSLKYLSQHTAHHLKLLLNFSCSDFMKLKFLSSIPYFNTDSPDFVFENICEDRGYEKFSL